MNIDENADAQNEGVGAANATPSSDSNFYKDSANNTQTAAECLSYWDEEMEFAREVFEPVAAWLQKLAHDDDASLEIVAGVLSKAAGSVWFATEQWQLVYSTRALAVLHGDDSIEITRLWWELFNRPPRRAERRLLRKAAKLARISQTGRCIGARTLRKLLCSNDLLESKETPRCRQSVARICLGLQR